MTTPSLQEITGTDKPPAMSHKAKRLHFSQTAAAQYYQRKGWTFTEIALQLNLPRGKIVDALYWKAIR